MKSAAFVFVLAVASGASARDFRPAVTLENISAADGSVQRCQVIQTTAGLRYVIQSSPDLFTWTAEREFYGLGQEHITTLHESAPAPVPPEGSPPVVLPPPGLFVSL